MFFLLITFMNFTYIFQWQVIPTATFTSLGLFMSSIICLGMDGNFKNVIYRTRTMPHYLSSEMPINTVCSFQCLSILSHFNVISYEPKHIEHRHLRIRSQTSYPLMSMTSISPLQGGFQTIDIQV